MLTCETRWQLRIIWNETFRSLDLASTTKGLNGFVSVVKINTETDKMRIVASSNTQGLRYDNVRIRLGLKRIQFNNTIR